MSYKRKVQIFVGRIEGNLGQKLKTRYIFASINTSHIPPVKDSLPHHP